MSATYTPLADIAARVYPITTIILESVGWVTKTLVTDHEAGWKPGSLYIGLLANNANKKIPPMVLLEKDVIGQTVHDTYAENEALLIGIPQPSDMVALRLKDNTDIEVGDFVVPAAGGTVVKYDSSDTGVSDNDAAILGMAMADLDLTSGNQGNINLLPVLLF